MILLIFIVDILDNVKVTKSICSSVNIALSLTCYNAKSLLCFMIIQFNYLQGSYMQELILDKDVLITSKTDLKGNVLYCNKPFLDYAEYDEEEVLFKSHNIVRHEDMPKCVFRILWEHIKQGKEVFAFVKNKTKHNNFYWVFANITPNYNQHNQVIGYYSVRRKPNEAAIAVISKIYEETLRIEKTQGIDKAYNFILEYAKNANLTYNNLVLNLQRNGHVA